MKNFVLPAIFLISVFFSSTVCPQNFGRFNNIRKTFPIKVMDTHVDAIPAGTYSVGVSGDFPTIDSLFNRLSMDGIEGPVTFELTDNLYIAPHDAYGFFLNGPIPGADQNNRVMIKPASNVNVTIEGSGGGIFTFLNTSYLTIDGSALTGSTTLTVHAIIDTLYTPNLPISLFNNSDHNEVKNINVIDEDYSYHAGPIGLFDMNSSEDTPDSNLVENNSISGGCIGVVIVSNSSSFRPVGNQVIANKIGSESDSLKAWGIDIENCSNTLIEKNVIQKLRKNINEENTTYGIQLVGSDNSVIRSNVIHDLYDETGSLGALAIVLVGGMDNMVYNNMIYDIRSSDLGNYLAGILLFQETNPKIYYNSIYLTGSAGPGSTDMFVQSGTSNIDLKDNIFVNTRIDSPQVACLIKDYADTNLTSNYNDIYCSPGPNNHLVDIFGTYYNTLADWDTTGHDSNSISEMPHFIDPDLHISTTDATYIESGGVPIPGILTDIDGDTRNDTMPDIGADEFQGIRPPVGIISSTFQTPLKFSLEQNYPNPFNPTTKIKYSLPKAGFTTLKVYDITGREVATLLNEYKTAGGYEIQFNATNLASGVYFYRLNTGQFSAVKKLLLLK